MPGQLVCKVIAVGGIWWEKGEFFVVREGFVVGEGLVI